MVVAATNRIQNVVIKRSLRARAFFREISVNTFITEVDVARTRPIEDVMRSFYLK
jgi:hypothetical protein